jgi:hypothetical protein
MGDVPLLAVIAIAVSWIAKVIIFGIAVHGTKDRWRKEVIAALAPMWGFRRGWPRRMTLERPKQHE